MNIARWEPFREMDEFFRHYAPVLGRRRNGHEEWSPTANITESDKEYLIKAELPEVKREDVKVDLADGVITIRGERKFEKEDKSANEIRIEGFYGNFSRSFLLPDNVDVKAVRAESKDGVLRVHLPKTVQAAPKAIAIDVK